MGAKNDPIGGPRAANLYSLPGKCVEILNSESIWKRAVILKCKECVKEGRKGVEHEVLYEDEDEPIDVCLEDDWTANSIRVVQLKVSDVFQKNVLLHVEDENGDLRWWTGFVENVCGYV